MGVDQTKFGGGELTPLQAIQVRMTDVDRNETYRRMIVSCLLPQPGS